MNPEWVDAQLAVLEQRLGSSTVQSASLFEPTAEFYGLLETGEDDDLRQAVAQVANHPPVAAHLRGSIPDARYLSAADGRSLSREDGKSAIGGAVFGNDQVGYHLLIPFSLMGELSQTGCVIAHELCHLVLRFARAELPDKDENEYLTDLTAVFVGLGKLLLNGKEGATSAPTYVPHTHRLGPLRLKHAAYAFHKVCIARGVERETALRNLDPRLVARMPLF